MSSAAANAVFLSYASQDADVVRMIADALRGAGVEVWFDQSELVGGDAWDQKIRKQIAECALFVPVLSAATQARREGYFRLEWRIAAQRTHMMSESAAFLLPVVIDATRDAEADVPSEFKAVQWTRLLNGASSDAFCARVKKLLGGNAEVETRHPHPVGRDGRAVVQGQIKTSGPTPASRRRRWAFAAVAMIAVALVARWQLGGRTATPEVRSAGANPRAASPADKAPPQTEAHVLVGKARQVLDEGDELNQDIYFLAEDLLKRAVALDPAEPTAWALQARLSVLMIWHRLDHSDARREAMRRQAERARALAPDLPEAQIASADARAMLRQDLSAIEQELRGLAARAPKDWRIQRSLGIVYRGLNRREDAIRAFRRARELSDSSPLTSADLANVLLRSSRPEEVAEAEKVIAQALAKQTSGRLLTFDVLLRTQWRGDLEGAKRALGTWPGWLLHESRGAILAWRTWLWSGNYDQAIAVAQRIPRDYLHDTFFVGPRAVLTARAHEAAGHAEAARSDWQIVVTLTNRELASAPNDVVASYWKAWALARLGDAAGAQAICSQLQQRNQLVATGMTGAQYFGGPGAAALWAAVGIPERALAELRAPPVNDFFAITRPMLELDPAFASVRSDPGFAAVVAAAPRLENIAPPAAATLDQKSVAVLAFKNLSGDPTREFFSDGLSVAIADVLGRAPGLRVTASTSAFSFKGKDVSAPEIARQLGVSHLVEGTVLQEGQTVRISAKLIQADGFQVWVSDKLERELKNIFALHDEVAGLIAQQLSLKLGVAAASSIVASPEAYQHLLQARFFSRGDTNEGWRRSIDECKAALLLDPKFAPAWAEMARGYIQLARFSGLGLAEAFAGARTAAERAVALAPELAEAQNAMGWVQRTIDWDWRRAEASFRRAYELAPGNAGIICDYAIIQNNTGRFAPAIELGRRALELDPLNASTRANLGLFLGWGGRYDEAAAEMQRAIALAPAATEWHAYLARFELLRGRGDAAAAAAEAETSERYRLIMRALALVTRKERAAADRVIQDVIERYADREAGYIAEYYAWAGERDLAFLWLERAREHRETILVWILGHRTFSALHADPRWPAFVRKLGLAEDQLR